MAEQHATWARIIALAHVRFPNDVEPAANIMREAFDDKEGVVYAAAQDAAKEEHVVFDAVRGATWLRAELRKEVPATDKEDNGDFLTDLPKDDDASNEQKALLVSFVSKRRNEVGRQFMVAKRQVALGRTAAAHRATREVAHQGNWLATTPRSPRHDGSAGGNGHGATTSRCRGSCFLPEILGEADDKTVFTDFLEDAKCCREQISRDRQAHLEHELWRRHSYSGAGPGEDGAGQSFNVY
jgi:hypothetical protein